MVAFVYVVFFFSSHSLFSFFEKEKLLLPFVQQQDHWHSYTSKAITGEKQREGWHKHTRKKEDFREKPSQPAIPFPSSFNLVFSGIKHRLNEKDQLIWKTFLKIPKNKNEGDTFTFTVTTLSAACVCVLVRAPSLFILSTSNPRLPMMIKGRNGLKSLLLLFLHLSNLYP